MSEPASIEEERWFRGLWTAVAEPGDGTAGALVHRLGAAAAWRACAAGDAAAATGTGLDHAVFRQALTRWHPRLGGAEEAWRAAHRAGMHLVIPSDPVWPHRVSALAEHAPIGLWVRGRPDALVMTGPVVAVVGARACTGYGEHVTGEIVAGLAAHGATIVSGAAYGIDAAAHRSALASGGRTLAVLAGGVDRDYPAGNSDLLRRIADDSAVISEVPCGAAPTKWRFLARNRVIAALADATVVVEAGWRSGSLNTAGHAAQLGRALGAVPGPVTSAASAGCHRMLREHDAVCVTNAAEVLELVGAGPVPLPEFDSRHTGTGTRVLDAVSARVARTPVEVAERSGLSAQDCTAALGLLEVAGAVHRDETGRWRRTSGHA